MVIDQWGGMLGWCRGGYLEETTGRSLIFPCDEDVGTSSVCVRVCVRAHVWLFDRWRQHFFVTTNEDLPKHYVAHTHTLICSPEGHLELYKLALVGWGLSAGNLVRRCISLKVWTPHTFPTVVPNIMMLLFSSCSPPTSHPSLLLLASSLVFSPSH